MLSENNRPKDYISLLGKLRPFKVKYNSKLCIGNSGSEITSDVYITNKSIYETTSYLWNCTKKVDLDDNDKKFISLWDLDNLYESFNESNTPEWNRKEYIGLHDYKGYYGFFLPDLTEVVKLTSQDIRNITGPVYVTTEPCCPEGNLSDILSDCYDPINDKHYGRTVIYWLKKCKKTLKRKRTRKNKTRK